jgi:DNA-binding NarL/FixJ family response regulator
MCAQPRFKPVQLVENDDEMLSALYQADVLLVIPDPGELPDKLKATLSDARARTPKVRVVVLTEKREPDLVVAAFSSGAKGVFCLGTSRLDDLHKCIEKVHEGQIWANSEELNWVLGVFERSGLSARPLNLVSTSGRRLLSQREEDVVKLVVDGMQNREIAHTLNLSEHTIKNYLFRVYEKLGISTRAELMLYVLTPRQSVVSISGDDEPKALADGTWNMR